MKKRSLDEIEASSLFENSDIYLYNVHWPDYLSLIAEASLYLDKQELEKAQRFYKETDRNRFIICRIVLKFILAFHAETDLKQLVIDRGIHKKPYLKSHPKIYFNLSHSKDYGLIGVSTSPIGVDIENINYAFEFKELLPTVFNEKDRLAIEHAQDAYRTFFIFWTRKEAFVKALGKGIDNDFSTIPCEDGFYDDILFTKTPHGWQLKSIDIAEDYAGAIAYKTHQAKLRDMYFVSLPKNTKDLLLFYNPYNQV